MGIGINIGIDCFKLVKGSGKSIGIYNYTKNLIDNFVKNNVEFTIYIFGNKYNAKDFDIDEVNFINVNMNPFSKISCILWELFIVSSYEKKNNIDCMFFPRGFLPMFQNNKSVITIHDLIPFYYHEKYPHYFNKFEDLYIRSRMKASIKKASKIITISNYSKESLVKLYGNADSKTTVIYNGFNKLPESKLNLPKNEAKYDNFKKTKNYIFAVTSDLPHKNAMGIIASYKEYCSKVENPIDLVVVGVKDIDNYKNMLSDEIRKKITFYKYLDDVEFYRVFANATMLLFLSLIEGFGFPPLEAMQLKVPVICSNCTSIPEVVGDAAILVNPTNYNEVSNEIIRLIDDEDKRKQLIDKGLQNIQRFEWKNKIEEYIQFFETFK